jgi:hypothetical protein
MDSNDPTLNEKLQAYHKALEEEWSAQSPSTEDTPEELAKKARKLIIDDLPSLLEQAMLIAKMGTSDTVKMTAIKFLYEVVVPPKSIKGPAEPDPIDKLLAEIAKNDDSMEKE